MNIQDIDIATLLPQRHPFILVGRLLHYEDTCCITETPITPQLLLVEGDAFSEAGVIENIAQTCAARIGYYYKYILKQPVRIGVIAAVKNLEVKERPRVGQTIVTRMDVVSEVCGTTTLAKASVTCADKVVAQGDITITLTDNLAL